MSILKELNVHEVVDKEKIIRFLQFDRKTLEYSFNKRKLLKLYGYMLQLMDPFSA